MNLTVPSSTALAASAATSHPGPALKWMWAAIGVLGVSVLALGAMLVVQHRSPATAGSATAPTQLSATPRTPDAEVIDEERPQAPVQYAQGAIEGEANHRPPAALGAAGRSGPVAGGSMVPGGAGPAQAVRDTAPVCRTCGHVESVQAVQQAAPATGVGAVAGGVLGAVVGNQIGKGSGRTAATVLGAVGGGYVGHKVEERSRTHTVYQIAVRMEDGSLRRFQRAEAVAVGTLVTLQGKGFVIGSPSHRGSQEVPYGQPGMVRTGG